MNAWLDGVCCELMKSFQFSFLFMVIIACGKEVEENVSVCREHVKHDEVLCLLAIFLGKGV